MNRSLLTDIACTIAGHVDAKVRISVDDTTWCGPDGCVGTERELWLFVHVEETMAGSMELVGTPTLSDIRQLASAVLGEVNDSSGCPACSVKVDVNKALEDIEEAWEVHR